MFESLDATTCAEFDELLKESQLPEKRLLMGLLWLTITDIEAAVKGKGRRNRIGAQLSNVPDQR